MEKRRDISKNKFASGLVRGAVVSGLTVTLAAASLGGPPNAEATCLGIFGISINLGDGGHCSSSLFGFALGLGPNTVATGDGFFNAAIAVGSNVTALAGTAGSLDFLNLALNAGNATDGATSTVTAGGGGFNLAANLGGDANAGSATGVPEPMDISAGDGFGNVALNVIGNRNRVSGGGGFLNFAVASGLFGQPGGANGSDNDVTATGSLSAALNSQTFLGEACPVGPCGNEVNANGPLSLVVAAGVVQRLVEGDFGITLANSFNSGSFPPKPPPATVLAAGGTQGSLFRLDSTGSSTNGVAAGGTQGHRVRPSLNAALNRPKATSAGGDPVQKPDNERITTSTKKGNDTVKKVKGDSPKRAKAGADGTNGGDK